MPTSLPTQISLPELTATSLAILDRLTHGVICLDRHGVICYLNRLAAQLLETDREQTVGRRVDMLPLRHPLYKVLSEARRDETLEVSLDGTLLAVSMLLITDAGVLSGGELVEVRDVTADKRQRRQREEVVAMMTHDLKSPLTVLMGYLQAVREEMVAGGSEMLRGCFSEMERSAQKLQGMIEDILDAYRLEAGLFRINKHHCDLRPLFAGCCREFMVEAERYGVDLRYKVTDNSIPALADGKQLSRVFANLIGNALKFTPRHGSVAVEGHQMDGVFRVTVRDTGIGIPGKDLPKIFNKYFRASGTSGFKGTGLGLSITKAIVDAHDGSIEVESQEGEGSCFTVVIPCGISLNKGA